MLYYLIRQFGLNLFSAICLFAGRKIMRDMTDRDRKKERVRKIKRDRQTERERECEKDSERERV